MSGSKDSVTGAASVSGGAVLGTIAIGTVGGSASVSGGASSVTGSMTPAKQSVLQKIEDVLHRAEESIAHDEAALVDFVKRHL